LRLDGGNRRLFHVVSLVKTKNPARLACGSGIQALYGLKL